MPLSLAWLLRVWCWTCTCNNYLLDYVVFGCWTSLKTGQWRDLCKLLADSGQCSTSLYPLWIDIECGGCCGRLSGLRGSSWLWRVTFASWCCLVLASSCILSNSPTITNSTPWPIRCGGQWLPLQQSAMEMPLRVRVLSLIILQYLQHNYNNLFTLRHSHHCRQNCHRLCHDCWSWSIRSTSGYHRRQLGSQGWGRHLHPQFTETASCSRIAAECVEGA